MNIETITYLSGSIPVKAYLGIPGEANPHEPMRGLVYCRGGIGRVGMPHLPWIEDFMAHRMVVIAPWYRGTMGNPGRDEFGGADCEDVDAAYRYLQSLPFVQPECVSVMGFSRGAINAAKSAVTIGNPHRLILWGGVSNLDKTYEERVDLRRMLKRVLGGSPAKVPEEYFDRSPRYMAPDISCPTLVVHATDDVQVAFHHGVDMVHALKDSRKTVEFHAYQGYGHHFHPDVRKAVIHRIVDFLRR